MDEEAVCRKAPDTTCLLKILFDLISYMIYSLIHPFKFFLCTIMDLKKNTYNAPTYQSFYKVGS